MKVKEVLSAEPVICSSETYLQEVVQTMNQNNLSCLPVVESMAHKNPIGVITEKSICRRSIAEGLNPLRLTAGRVMNSNFKTVSPETSLEDCYRIIKSCKVRYLVVTDENNVCHGLITEDDVLGKLTPQTPFFVNGEFSSYNKIKQIAGYDRIF